jgi:hypothetical protein
MASSRGSTPARDREEAGLHDRVDASGHADVVRHAIGIDDVEADPLADDLLLHRPRQLVPHLVWTERTVQEEHGTVDRLAQHLHALDELELVARHEPGALQKVSRADGPRAEPQVRCRA